MSASDAVGRCIANRFHIEAVAGRGGMAIVYRATDATTGQTVALKMLSGGVADDQRFERECRLIEGFEHVHLVKHITHGRSAEGELFLALEWLEGSPLSARLRGGQLSVADTLRVGSGLARALEEIHAQGIVHRDIKPSNIFLVDDDLAKLKLLDFGIARQTESRTHTTQSGTLLGSIGYIAPEQARDAKSVDQRSDFFAMGCVLYECLTGVPPFSGGGSAAVLARILLDKSPSIRTLRPDAPIELSDLVLELLSKEPDGRPQSASAIHDRLTRVALDLPPEAEHPAPPAVPIRSGEERISTVLIFGASEGNQPAETAAATIPLTPRPVEADALIQRYRAALTPLLHGLSIVTIDEAVGGPTERACRCASLALELSRGAADGPFVIATGRTEASSNHSFGLAVERAIDLLEEKSEIDRVYADAITAELLQKRYELEEIDAPRAETSSSSSTDTQPITTKVFGVLRSLRRSVAAPAPGLPRSHVPHFVGRKKELDLLEATLDEVLEERMPQALLIDGPAGIGKSELAREAFSHLASRGARWLETSADPLMHESAGRLLASLLRRAAAVTEDGREDHWPAFRDHVMRLAIAEPDRSAEILAELAGLNPPEPVCNPLHAGREDPAVLGYWTSLTLPEWLRCEAHSSGLVILIDDLHWADEASLSLLDRALHDAGETAILIVGLLRERDEIRGGHGFASIATQRLCLSPLSKMESHTLTRKLLPPRENTLIESIADRSGGHPFFLHELVRSVERGHDGLLPASAAALIEERIERVDSVARRVLRAASVFGERAPVEGIARLVGDALGSDTAQAIDLLIEEELLQNVLPIGPRRGREVAFRHALLRESAYAMLPADDRRGGHLQAARWLEARGESDAALLAEHWQRAEHPDEASRHLATASETALARGDARACIRLASRGLALKPTGTLRARLLHSEAYALGFGGDFVSGTAKIREALELAKRGTHLWYSALAGVVFNSAATSDAAGFREAIRILGDLREPLEVSAQASFALYLIASACYQMAGASVGEPYVQALERMTRADVRDNAQVRGWALNGNVRRAWHHGRPVQAYRFREASLASFMEAGDPLGISSLCGPTAFSAATLGLEKRSRQACAQSLRLATSGGLGFGLDYARLAEAILDARTKPDASLDTLQKVMNAGSMEVRNFAAIITASVSLAVGETKLANTAAEALRRAAVLPARRSADAIFGLVALQEGDIDRAKEHLRRCAAPTNGALAAEDAGLYWIAGNQIEQLRLGLLLARREPAQALADDVRTRMKRCAAELSEEEQQDFWRAAFQVPETMTLVEQAELS